MAKNLKKNGRKGFTIIEVVLVLAIAGLIFLMVFIALPALQRSQRNTQRQDDVARVVSQVTQYQSNNGGKLPVCVIGTTGCPNSGWATGMSGDTFRTRYLDTNATNQFSTPEGNTYTISTTTQQQRNTALGNTGWNGWADNTIYIVPNTKCSGTEGNLDNGGGNRKFAVVAKLEGGAITCNDNQ